MIREYRDTDIDAVIAVWEKANSLAHPFLSSAFVSAVKADMRAKYLPNSETWVIEVDAQVVGFISMIGREIGGLFLDPEFHGRGLGRAMVDCVVDLKGPLRVEVFRDNEVGLPFYERYGFNLVEEYLHEASGAVTFRMAMPGAPSE